MTKSNASGLTRKKHFREKRTAFQWIGGAADRGKEEAVGTKPTLFISVNIEFPTHFGGKVEYNLQCQYIRHCQQSPRGFFQSQIAINSLPFVATLSAKDNTGRQFNMFKICCLFLSIVLILQVVRACDNGNGEQLAAARERGSIEYLTNAYGFAPYIWIPNYHQPSIVQGIKISILLCPSVCTLLS